MQLYEVISQAIEKPPLQFDPQKNSLKNWAIYCLRDRGFKVVYAQNADFAIEVRRGEKVYFKVTNSAVDLDKAYGWIVWDSLTNSTSVIAPQP